MEELKTQPREQDYLGIFLVPLRAGEGKWG